MLNITIPKQELWDSVHEKFVYTPPVKLQLEHSLVSLSKWESEWHKAFLDKRHKKTPAEIIDYVRCMTVTGGVKPETYLFIDDKILKEIMDYIDNPMTATKVAEDLNAPGTNEPITSEMLYGQMIMYNIPVEFEKWHLNRLLTLIKVCRRMNTPPKRMSKSQIYSRNASLNAYRRKLWGTTG